jgi:hypothetical protein
VLLDDREQVAEELLLVGRKIGSLDRRVRLGVRDAVDRRPPASQRNRRLGLPVLA